MRLLLASGTVAACLFGSSWAYAQDEANSVTAGVSYVFGTANAVVETEGAEVGNVDVIHHTITVSGEYVTPVKGLAVEAELPFTGTKWDDSSVPHTPVAGEWDDGSLHWSAVDLRAGLTYQLLEEPLGIELSLAGSIPVTDYPVVGYTAPGRGLKGLHAGVTFMRTLEPILPRLYVTAGYEFSLMEKFDEAPGTDDWGQNYSDFTAQIGYLVLDNLEIHAAFQGHIQHGGIDFVKFTTYTPEEQEFHDGILREEWYLLGGGLGYQLTEAFSLGADVRFFMAGANTHNWTLIGLSASYKIL